MVWHRYSRMDISTRVRMNPRTVLAAVVLAATSLFLPLPLPVQAADPVVVFAASSLKDALDDVSTRYLNATGRHVAISYGASSTLAQQIEQAAPADIFFSADLNWMNELQAKNLVRMG